MIVVSGPIAQPAPMLVAPRRNVEGSIVVSRPIVTVASISVLAGSTIVTPARWWASWIRRCARRVTRARSTRSFTPRARSGSRKRVRLDRAAAGGEERQDAGQVQLALGVVGVERRRARRAASPPSNRYRPALTSRMASSCSVASPADLVSATRSTAPSASADHAAVGGRVVELHARDRRGGAGLLVGVDEPGDRLARDERHVAVDHQDRRAGLDEVRRGGHRVPRARAGRAGSRPRRRRAGGRASSCLGLSTTITRSAPAARAASSGQRIMGRPQIGCRTLGSAERILVPSPAARMTTVGAGMRWHRSIAVRSATDRGWCNR